MFSSRVIDYDKQRMRKSFVFSNRSARLNPPWRLYMRSHSHTPIDIKGIGHRSIPWNSQSSLFKQSLMYKGTPRQTRIKMNGRMSSIAIRGKVKSKRLNKGCLMLHSIHRMELLSKSGSSVVLSVSEGRRNQRGSRDLALWEVVETCCDRVMDQEIRWSVRGQRSSRGFCENMINIPVFGARIGRFHEDRMEGGIRRRSLCALCLASVLRLAFIWSTTRGAVNISIDGS